MMKLPSEANRRLARAETGTTCLSSRTMMTNLAALLDRKRDLIERRQSAPLERMIEVEVELRAIDRILFKLEGDGPSRFGSAQPASD